MDRKKRKILLVDDHRYVSETLRLHLEERHGDRLQVTGTPADGAAAFEEARRSPPDLVVLDLNLPRVSGMSLLPRLKELPSKPLVLVLSSYDDRAHVLEAVRAGADDYLFKKDATPARVADHILRALAKSLPVQDEMHALLFDALRSARGEGGVTLVEELTGMELEVLKLAAYKGCSAKDVSQELSGGRMSVRTVAAHWQHIYDKLGARSQAQAVCLAVKRGVISADGAEETRDAADA